MAKKSKPRLGWQPKSGWRWEDTGCYPDDVVSSIATRFEISGEASVHRLKERLETAGTMYRDSRFNMDGPSPPEVRAYFNEIIEHCDRLLELIDDADNKSWNLLWPVQEQLRFSGTFEGDTRLEEIGALRRAHDGDPDDFVAEVYDISEVSVGLRYMRLLATEAGLNVEPGSVGRKRNVALYLWVHEMARYWENELGRKFTVSSVGNLPSSPVGHFLEACLRPLDADAVLNLVSQMREELKVRKNEGQKKT